MKLISDLLTAPFWTDAKFYFALFAGVVIFSQRFGFTFTAQEIASVNLLIAVAFGIAPPSIQYLQVRALNRRIKHMKEVGLLK